MDSSLNFHNTSERLAVLLKNYRYSILDLAMKDINDALLKGDRYITGHWFDEYQHIETFVYKAILNEFNRHHTKGT